MKKSLKDVGLTEGMELWPLQWPDWTNEPNCRASHCEYTTLLNKCFVTSTEMMWCLPLLHFRPAFYRNAPVSLVKCKRKKLCQRSWVRPDQDRQLTYRTYFVPSPKKKKIKNSETFKFSAFNLRVCVDVPRDRRQMWLLWLLEELRFLQYKEMFMSW